VTSNLYVDPAIGQEVITHSAMKTFRRCPRQYWYKYILRLKPRAVGTPLKRGTWMHELLETHHKGENWKMRHVELCKQYDELLDEERDYYGNLPEECYALMRAYVYYYKQDAWQTRETEYTIETQLPMKSATVIYRGRVDILFDDLFGLWIGDHKTHRSLPDLTFRLLDAQSALYLWAALDVGLPVEGFMWNYLVTAAPSKPRVVKAGDRLYKKMGATDYHTFGTEIKRLLRTGELRFVPSDVKETLAKLKAMQHVPGEPQTSQFFRRDRLEKDPRMLDQVVSEAVHTVARIRKYPFNRPELIERVIDRGCSYCSFRDLCTVELLGGDTRYLLKNNFKEGDPMEYYQDRVPEKREDES
jgi:CRISPR/Cas system-associated exonuclease Cas4 (RecB family)